MKSEEDFNAGYSWFFWACAGALILAILLMFVLPGCVTTTMPDGTTTTQIDTQLVAALTPIIAGLVQQYLDAQASKDIAETEAKAEQLRANREMLNTLIKDEALRDRLLSIIDNALQKPQGALENVS